MMVRFIMMVPIVGDRFTSLTWKFANIPVLQHSVSDPYTLNPDPAKHLNPDPDPEDPLKPDPRYGIS